MKTIGNTFGQYIRGLRKENKIPLRLAAEQLGVDRTTLGKIERGQRNANLYLIEQLAVMYKVEEKELKNKFLCDKIFLELKDEINGLDIIKEVEQLLQDYKAQSTDLDI